MLGFLFWFLIIIAVLAVVIIAGRWLIGSTGIAIPQPLMVCIGIVLFIVLLIALWHFVGAEAFGPSPRFR